MPDTGNAEGGSGNSVCKQTCHLEQILPPLGARFVFAACFSAVLSIFILYVIEFSLTLSTLSSILLLKKTPEPNTKLLVTFEFPDKPLGYSKHPSVCSSTEQLPVLRKIWMH